MTSHETDYLVIGAGAVGLAFVDTLLDDKITEDERIDQSDFAEMLSMFCHKFHAWSVAGYNCPDDRWSDLPGELKRIFASGLCPEEDKKLDCLASDGRDSDIDNYFIAVTTSTSPVVEAEVQDICFEVFPFPLFFIPQSDQKSLPHGRGEGVQGLVPAWGELRVEVRVLQVLMCERVFPTWK